MNILFFTIGTEVVASSRTRVYQFIPHLKKEGLRCRIISYLSERRCRDDINMNKLSIFRKLSDKFFSWLQILKVLFLASRYDVVFIQRILLPVFIQKVLTRINQNMIYDFDDALQFLEKRFFSCFINMLRYSKTVIVENDFNKSFVLKYNSNVEILTGPIDIDRCRPKDKTNQALDGKVSLGWIGSPSTSIYLRELMGVFTYLQKKYPNLAIKVIGAGNFSLPGVNIVCQDWKIETEVEYLQNLDIGIMPLRDDGWSKGKGGYKLLQYMAVGIPCVASPVGVNKDIVDESRTGFFAKTPEEWMEKLSILIEGESLREKMGIEGRRKAETIYSYQANLVKMVGILKKVSDEQ